jgi:hypothetical protein
VRTARLPTLISTDLNSPFFLWTEFNLAKNNEDFSRSLQLIPFCLLDQRVTGFVIHLFVGLAILLAPVLREIPMAVVFGVFLYLGICSLNGVDFVDRVYLFFYPPKHHPSAPYVQHVRKLTFMGVRKKGDKGAFDLPWPAKAGLKIVCFLDF